MLPPLDPATGAIPPGRHPATVDEIYDRFVDHPDYGASVYRSKIWEGFLDYLAAWDAAEQAVGEKVVMALWIGGSFVTTEMEPEDLDLSPVIDHEIVSALDGVPGVGKVKKLIDHRVGVREKFLVEPFVLRWSAHPCTLFPENLDPAVQNMLMHRGGLDEWWTRLRPSGPKGAPVVPNGFAERGYLEVLR